ncbi:MAG: hypothetical protein WBP81_14015 [Solirubrobacteraceae bacterium]
MTWSDSQDGSTVLDGIPVRWVTRDQATGGEPRGIAVWLRFLGGTKDVVLPMLERLAEGLDRVDRVRNPDAMDRCLDWLSAG